MKHLFLVILLSACASRPASLPCTGATETIKLSKKEAEKIQGKVSQFLSDARITQEPSEDGKHALWRFKNMPDDSVYYKIGLREGDAISKTNLGEEKSSIELISDLSGIASGTTDCLYVTAKDKSERIIRIVLEKN